MRTLRLVAPLVVALVACGDDTPSSAPSDAGPVPSDAGSGGPALEVGALTAVANLMGVAPTRDAFLLAPVTVRIAASATAPVPVAPVQFSLVLADQTSLLATALPTPGGCAADRLLEPGGVLTCTVGFDVATSMVLGGVRFLDVSTQTTVTAPTPSDRVPMLAVDREAQIGDLGASELAAVCAQANFPTSGQRELCSEGVDVVVPDDPAARCNERRLPFATVRGPECVSYEANDCTVGGLLDCARDLASDLCSLIDMTSSCACARPAIGPTGPMCP